MTSFKDRIYLKEELTCGLWILEPVIGFVYKPYHKRTGADQSSFDNLRGELLTNGMRNPLITWNGSVLIGQRRFSILYPVVECFPCWEIQDNVMQWNHANVQELIKSVQRLYRDRDRNKSLKNLIPPSWNMDCGEIESYGPENEKQMSFNFG